MAIIKKAAISLVITLILFTAFTIISYTTLFDFIESKFYNKKVIAGIETRIENIITTIEEYKNSRIEILTAVSNESAIRNSFLINQSREDIFKRENIINSLVEHNIDFNFIRVIDENGKVHYSSSPADLQSSDPTKISYKVSDEAAIAKYKQIAGLAGNNPAIVFNAEEGSNVFAAPVYSNTGVKRGAIFVYLTANDLKNYLVQKNIIERNIVVKYLDHNSIVFNILDNNSTILNEVTNYWNRDQIINPYSLYSDADGNSYSIVTEKWVDGFIGYVLPDSLFKINTVYRYILLFSAFSIIYILSFLLMNIKQDQITVIAERVKRFQINFLIEYLENKSEVEWKIWKKELENRKEEVRKEFKKGVRGLKGDKDKIVNDLIDKSWDEIISLLAGHLDKKSDNKNLIANLQVNNIEDIIRKIISSEDNIRNKEIKSSAKTVIKPQEIETSGTVKSIAENTPSAAYSKTKPVEEAEPLAEVEEAEEVGEVEDLEEIEEAAPLDEVEELEEVEALEEIEDAEPVEELDEAESLDEVKEAIAEVEEAEEVGEVEELEEIEETEAFEKAEEIPQSLELEAEEQAIAEAEEEITSLELLEPEAEHLDELTELEEEKEEFETSMMEEDVEELEDVTETALEPTENKLTKTTSPDEDKKFKELISVYKDYGEEIVSANEIQTTIEEIEQSVVPITDGEDDVDLEKLTYFKNKLQKGGESKDSRLDNIPELVEEVEILDDKDAVDLEDVNIYEEKTEKWSPDSVKIEALEVVKDFQPLVIKDEYEELELLEEAETPIEDEEARIVEYIKNDIVGVYKPNYMSDIFYANVKKAGEVSDPAEKTPLEEITKYNLENLDSAAFPEQVKILQKNNLLEIWTIKAVNEMFESESRKKEPPVIEKNGILEINEDLYNTADNVKNDELKELIDTVVEKEEEFEVNVSDLFFNDVIDLPVFSDVTENKPIYGEKNNIVKINEDYGFDYDLYFNFSDKDSSIAVMKLLFKITREIDSSLGAILVPDEKGYYPEISVGFFNKNYPGLLKIKKDSPLSIEFLSERKIVFLKTGIEKIEELKSKFSASDSEKIKSLLLFPIKYKEKQAYLIASPNIKDISFHSLMLKVKNLQLQK